MRRWTCGLLAFGLTVGLVACARDEVPEPTAFEIDRAELAAKFRAGRSRGEMLRATGQAMLLAHLTREPRDLDRAEHELSAAIAQGGAGLGELLLIRAWHRFQVHRLDEAERDLAASGHGETRLAWILRSDLARERGRYAEARSFAERAASSGLTWEVAARQAFLRLLLGDENGARELYRATQEDLSAKEMSAFAFLEVQLGRLELRRGRFAAAEAHFRRAEAAYPGDPWVAEHLAEVLAARKNFAAAEALYRDLLRRSRRPELRQAAAAFARFRGRPDLARPLEQEALAAFRASVARGEPRYLHHLVEALLDSHPQEALAAARRDATLRPNPLVRTTLALALYRNGLLEEATAEVETALASGVEDIHLFDSAALIFAAAGRAAERDHWRARALALDQTFGSTFHIHR